MDSQFKSRLYAAALNREPLPVVETVFVAPDIARREDAQKRKDRLSQLVAAEIVPRLVALHRQVPLEPLATSPSEVEIVELAHLVLSPQIQAAAEYVTILRERGLPMETLFVQLLQPAARHLGKMWDNDECDFVDVTLGVGELQLLLSIFNCTHNMPALEARRRVLLTCTPGEQHMFGLAMVAKLLSAAGWTVTSDVMPTIEDVIRAVSRDWHAVAGVTLSSEVHIDRLAETIAAIRKHSRNPAIGIMVGGAQFLEHPDLVARVGADATAIDATTAVLLAQKLFDDGAKSDWFGTAPQS
jgi:methanogenic corrinoid protein MtbC1